MGVSRNVKLDAALCQEFVRAQAKIAKRVNAVGVFLEDSSSQYDYDKSVTQFRVKAVFKKKGKLSTAEIASFKMRELPGCCGIVVHYYARIASPKAVYANALAKMLLAIREAAAKTAGYSMQLATLRADNKKELAVYHAAQWQDSGQFVNNKTTNLVIYLTKYIEHEAEQREATFGAGE